MNATRSFLRSSHFTGLQGTMISFSMKIKPSCPRKIFLSGLLLTKTKARWKTIRYFGEPSEFLWIECSFTSPMKREALHDFYKEGRPLSFVRWEKTFRSGDFHIFFRKKGPSQFFMKNDGHQVSSWKPTFSRRQGS